MEPDKNKNTVFIKRCEEYNRGQIEHIVTEGIRRLKFSAEGRVFVKPNVVFAFDTARMGHAAYTAPPLVGAALTALSREPGVKRIDMGEKTAVGVPTRLCYKHAGYYDEVKAVRKKAGCPVKIFCMEEEKREPVFVGGKVHDVLRIPKKMAKADKKVYLPKLKCHCVSAMTGAVKLNIGICSDDERSIRHDFLLNEKIVDLLAAGYPDLVVMDAIDVGMGNEAFPTTRKLGLVIMGKNPLSVDLVGARLLGLKLEDVSYLKAAVDRGYTPASLEEITIDGDLKSIEDLDEEAKRLQPYDEEFYRWQDVNKELARLHSPMKFYWGPYNSATAEKCLTGCVMGIKMFLGGLEKFAGPAAFAASRPVSFVIGKYDASIDAAGEEVFLLGSCARANIKNAKKIIHLNKCFTTAADMHMGIGHRMGMPALFRDRQVLKSFGAAVGTAAFKKLIMMRYFQDIGYFISRSMLRRI